MRSAAWKAVLGGALLLWAARTAGAILSPDICDQSVCVCDSFRRVVCRCTRDYEEVTIKPAGVNKMLSTATHIEIENCNRVHFQYDAIKNLKELKSIKLLNLGSLSLSENAIFWPAYLKEHELGHPGLSLMIHNTTISRIPSYSIKGHIEDIIIDSSYVEAIEPFAFSNLIRTKRIDLINCTIKGIEPQAFKKFSLEKFIIKQGYIHSFPSRTLSDLEVRNTFSLRDLSVDSVDSSSFIISGVKKVIIENCRIGTIHGDAFRIVTAGSVNFNNNTIELLDSGALLGISTYSQVIDVYGKNDFIFHNNSIQSFTPNSLKINHTSFNLLPKDLMVNKICSCSIEHHWERLSPYEDSVLCINEDYNSVNEMNKYRYLNIFKENNCYKRDISAAIIVYITLGVLLIVFVIILSIVLYVRKRNASGLTWMTRKPGDQSKELSVIMPDGKTYRETELHIILEKAEFLTTDL